MSSFPGLSRPNLSLKCWEDTSFFSTPSSSFSFQVSTISLKRCMDCLPVSRAHVLVPLQLARLPSHSAHLGSTVWHVGRENTSVEPRSNRSSGCGPRSWQLHYCPFPSFGSDEPTTLAYRCGAALVLASYLVWC